MTRRPDSVRALRAVKVAHTIVWAIFAGSIVALPIAAFHQRMGLALVLISLVMVEVLILVANKFRCPLTNVAARFTADRSDNFDIYLPLWVARYNKQIFGSLFLIGLVYTLVQWQRSLHG
jgi:uncharacterized membrane protein